MSVVGTLSRHLHLSEFTVPLDTATGFLSANTRQGYCLDNLFGSTTGTWTVNGDLQAASGGVDIALGSGGIWNWNVTESADASAVTVTATSDSTAAATSIEPFLVSSTMTGAGGVGGRARFYMTTEVELGSWANALKAEVDWGTAGAVTGLGSAAVVEMTLGPGSEAGGTYGVLELELNAPASSGSTNVAFIYASMQGADTDALDDAVSLISLNGVTAGSGSIFQTFSQITNAAVQASLKIKINGTAWYIPLMDTQAGT